MSYSIGDGMAAPALAAGIVGYVYVTHRTRQKRIEIIHQERMAAMEKGIPFPEARAWSLTLVDSDSQLVASAQSGDQQAFAELVRRHSAPVFRLAVSILGREFIPEAEDVAQEVFLKVHHAIVSFRGEAELSSWIYRITFNQAVSAGSLPKSTRGRDGSYSRGDSGAWAGPAG